MKKYDVYAVRLRPMSEEAADVVAALLGSAGFDGFEQTEWGLNAYVPQGACSRHEVGALLAALPVEGVEADFAVEELEERDWNEEWERNGFAPIVVPGLCRIHSADSGADAGGGEGADCPYDIRLRPRMAFGTGTHETTAQLVELLLRRDFGGATVLDMGCGTGILGICMALRGARRVVGVDVDEASVENTRLNCGLNGVGQMEAVLGDASLLAPGGALGGAAFDCIVANIHRNVVVADLPRYAARLAAGGSVVLSGFFTADVPAVRRAAEDAGLELAHGQARNDWAVVEFRRGEGGG